MMDDTQGNSQQPPALLEPGAITKVEWRWVWVFAFLVMLVTTVPYLIGYASQGEDWRFTGFVFGVEDGNSYIAKMLSGVSGAWLFRTPYTAEPQRGVVAYLFYILLGKLASPPGLHEQLVALFHLFRIGAGILEILATYHFLAFFIESVRVRRSGLALATLGGGLGWLLIFSGKNQWLGSLPLEFYSPETFGFLGLYALPHLALARAGMLWGLLAYLRAFHHVAQPKFKEYLQIGSFWLLIALAQPVSALVMGFVLGLHWCSLAVWLVWKKIRSRSLEREKLVRATILLVAGGILPVPFLLYNALAFNIDPFLKRWTAQNIITSPHPAHYLLAYGLVIPFAIIGGRKLMGSHPWESWLLIGWALATPFLAYAPFNLQRRLPEGVWVVLVVLAMKAFEREVNRESRRGFWGVWALLMACLPSTLILLVGGVLTALRPGLPVFRPADEISAIDFIASHARIGDVVLSSYATGNALPAWAAVRVVIGHGPESVGLAELQARVAHFYQGAGNDLQRQLLIRASNVRYVFHGPLETALGDWQPDQAEYLHLVYQFGDYEVLQVDGK